MKLRVGDEIIATIQGVKIRGTIKYTSKSLYRFRTTQDSIEEYLNGTPEPASPATDPVDAQTPQDAVSE